MRPKTFVEALDTEKVTKEERLVYAQAKLVQALKTSTVGWARRVQNEVHGYERLNSVQVEGSIIILRLGDMRFRIIVEAQ